MQKETFPSFCESLLLRNLWRSFWCLAHNTACIFRMTSDIKYPSRSFRATAELSGEGIGPITPEEEGTGCAAVIWVPVIARHSCSWLVMLQKWSGPLIVALCIRPQQLALHGGWCRDLEKGKNSHVKAAQCVCKRPNHRKQVWNWSHFECSHCLNCYNFTVKSMEWLFKVILIWLTSLLQWGCGAFLAEEALSMRHSDCVACQKLQGLKGSKKPLCLRYFHMV